jgi:methyl-accepting chemotaxis protein
MDGERITKLATLAHAGLALEIASPEQVAAIEADSASLIQRDARYVKVPALFRYLEDPGGMVLGVSQERDVWKLGQRTLGYLILVVTGVGLAIMLALIYILRYFVLGPLKDLAQHINLGIEKGDLSSRLSTDRMDELGSLAHDYNRLLERVETRTRDLRDELVKRQLAEQTLEQT